MNYVKLCFVELRRGSLRRTKKTFNPLNVSDGLLTGHKNTLYTCPKAKPQVFQTGK